MRLRKVILMIFGILFLFGVQSKTDEEMVGSSVLAKLRAAAAKAQVEHNLALYRLKAHLPRHLLSAANPLESLNYSEPVLAESTSPVLAESTSPVLAESTSPVLAESTYSDLVLLETTEIPPKLLNHPDSVTESSSFQTKLAEPILSAQETTEPFLLAISAPESSIKNQPTSISRTSSDDIIFNDATTITSNTVETKSEISTMKANVNFDKSDSSNPRHSSNTFSKQKEKSSSLFYNSHKRTEPKVENDNSKHGHLNLIDVQNLPKHLSTSTPNSMHAFKPNEDMSTPKISNNKHFMIKNVHPKSTTPHPQEIPFIENKFHKVEFNNFKNNQPKSKNFEGATYYSQEVPLIENKFHEVEFKNSRKNQLTPENVNFEGAMLAPQEVPFIENKFHDVEFKNSKKEQLMPKSVNFEGATYHSRDVPHIETKFHEAGFKNSRKNQFMPKSLNFESTTSHSQESLFIENKFHEAGFKNSRKNQLIPKSTNETTSHLQEIPFIENKFHEAENFENYKSKTNQNVRNFKKPDKDISVLENQQEQFTHETDIFESSTQHPQELSLLENKFHKPGNAFTNGNFESEIPIENRNAKNQFHFNNDFLVQRREHSPRNEQDEELFLQYLNTIQNLNNQGIIRTATEDVDQSDGNQHEQYVQNFPQIAFYPINWKTNEVCEFPVRQYELSPIKFQLSNENYNEDFNEPMAEKFHRLNKKMKSFQLEEDDNENDARAADPSDPRHFHSHSLEIHHTKHVRPSTFHSSFNKHKEVSSKFHSKGHSTHFSFQKDHWKEPPSTFDQTDKYHHKDSSAFGYPEKLPSTNNYHSSTKSLDQQHQAELSAFGHVENSPSPITFHSQSLSLDKQHTFGHSEKLPFTSNSPSSIKSTVDKQHHQGPSTFGKVENVPGAPHDEHHQKDLSIFGHVESPPSPTNYHSESLDKQHLSNAEHSGQVSHSNVLTPPPSHITVNNQNNFISTDSVNGNQNIQIAQSNGGPISQAQSHQSLRGDQPFDRSKLGSPYLFQIPRNADNRRFKRSFPLIKLFTDPNVQLDVSKTLENVGTVARNSFEDRRAPMYHVRNMMGSAKNTVLSTLKIPPQNAIVPSRYKIVDKKSEFPELSNDNLLGEAKNRNGLLKQTNENFLGNEIAKTFQNVGNVVRDSVRSGQETLQHVGDVFHNAKKAVSATRYSTPRLLLPYTRTPVLKRNKPDKIMLITPRFADVTHEDQIVGATQNDDFVKLGDIMDAVGVSNPDKKDVGLSRLVLQPKKLIAPSRKSIFDRKLMSSKKPNLQSRFGTDDSDLKQVGSAKKKERKPFFILREDVDRNEIDEVTNTLTNLRNMLGIKTLQDFLMYMKQKFLLEHLKDKLRQLEQGTESNENVGNGLALGNDLMKPFMGRPSKTELKNYFRKNGDSIEEDEDIHGPSVNAINPQVYANYFNETLKVNEKVRNLTEGALPEIATLKDDKIGDCLDDDSDESVVDMKVPKKLKKPFMGKKVRKDSKYFY